MYFLSSVDHILSLVGSSQTIDWELLLYIKEWVDAFTNLQIPIHLLSNKYNTRLQPYGVFPCVSEITRNPKLSPPAPLEERQRTRNSSGVVAPRARLP